MRFLFLFCFALLLSCSPSEPLINSDDVYAWCIVGFDSEKRSPHERLAMLKLIGVESYAYDWEEENLEEMAIEWELAKVNEIEINGVWLWLNAERDSLPNLSAANEQLLATMDESDLETQIWLGMNNNFFEGLSDEEAVAKGVEIVSLINEKAVDIKCSLSLYNHGDWFGEPANQIKILEAGQIEDVGIVYNFHHGHNHIDNFGEVVDVMLPKLRAVNINGMVKNGKEILPVGEGDYEQEMIKILFDKGYEGPIGILGHVDTSDVKEVLKNNLKGIKQLFAE